MFDRVRSVNCDHTYCEQCITDWLQINQLCPQCIQPLTDNGLKLARQLNEFNSQ